MTKITKAEIKEFVEAAHGNLEKVQRMLAERPELLHLPHGSETALGAACQMRHIPLIEFLLEQGEAMDIAAACVLGRVDRVAEMLEADPDLLTQGNRRSHGKKPLYFAENQSEVLALLKSRGAK